MSASRRDTRAIAIDVGRECTTTLSFGVAVRSAAIACGRNALTSVGEVARTSLPVRPSRSSCIVRLTVSMRPKISSRSGSSESASGVGWSRPPIRSNSVIRSCCSACLSTALTAGWVTCRLRAAAVIEPARMIA